MLWESLGFWVARQLAYEQESNSVSSCHLFKPTDQRSHEYCSLYHRVIVYSQYQTKILWMDHCLINKDGATLRSDDDAIKILLLIGNQTGHYFFMHLSQVLYYHPFCESERVKKNQVSCLLLQITMFSNYCMLVISNFDVNSWRKKFQSPNSTHQCY